MAIVVGTDILAMNAQRRLFEADASESRVMTRLSSGLRINRASDDAAGLAIASSLNANRRIYSKAVLNANDAISALNIAEGAVQQLSNIVFRQAELAEQSSNGVYSDAQRVALDRESDALVDEYNRIIKSTSFNGRNLLDAEFRDVRIQLGTGLVESLSISIGQELTRNVGDGTFGAMSAFAAGASPDQISAYDANGDGFDDLVVHDTGALVYLGNGDGSFKAASSYGNNFGSYFELRDVNGDDTLDYVSGSGTSVYLMLGNANGSFTAARSIAAVGAVSTSIGDIDGDGFMDLVSASSNLIEVFRGNGDGTFKAAVSSAGIATPTRVSIADVNNDGRDDVIVGNSGTSSGNGPRVFLGLANGFVGTGTNLPPPINSTPIFNSVFDFNGDGNVDVFTTSGTTENFVFLGNGNGTFKAGLLAAAYANPVLSEPDFADVNNDGLEDIIIGSSIGSSIISVMLSNGNGTFKAPSSFAAGSDPYGTAIADFDEDGVLDVAVANHGAGTVGILLGNYTETTTMARMDLGTQEGAREALTSSKLQIEKIARELGNIGSIQTRLGVATNNLRSVIENYASAESTIVDADVAEEAARLVAVQIRKQASVQVLARSTSVMEIALQLLRT